MQRSELLEASFNHAIPVCITDIHYTIITFNEAYRMFWGGEGGEAGGAIKCYDQRPGKSCHTEKCPMAQIVKGAKEYICEPSKEKDGQLHHFIVTAKPILDNNGGLFGIVEFFQDITERKRLEDENRQLIASLQCSLEKVNLLRGLLPICATCKKVRDDNGYWSQIESYISQHSEAQFSHGICPACAKKLYPEIALSVLEEIDKSSMRLSG